MAEDPAERLWPFAQTGGEGSMAALWLDGDRRTRVVHLGSGSGSLLTCVLSDNGLDFLRLLAIGYAEVCWNEEFAAPPQPWDEDGDTVNAPYRDWLQRTFGVTIPETGYPYQCSKNKGNGRADCMGRTGRNSTCANTATRRSLVPSRPHLIAAPHPLLEALERILGSPIATERPATSGYTPSVASWVTLASGDQVFVKAAPTTPEWKAMPIRNGIDLAPVVGELGPTLLASYEGHGWVAAVYEVIDGAGVERWEESDLPHLHEVLRALRNRAQNHRMADVTPFAQAFAAQIGTWQSLGAGAPGPDVDHLADVRIWADLDVTLLASLESHWHEALRGDSLVHGDLRGDNVVRETSGRLRVVDWTHRWTGPGWLDLVGLGPDLSRSGLDPQTVLTKSVWTDAPEDDINAALAGLGGYWFNAGHRPDIPHSPGLRELQRTQAAHALSWLTRRLG